MNEQNLQLQIDALNAKLDLILEEVVAQRQVRESAQDLMSDMSIIGKDAFSYTVAELDKAGVEFDGEAFKVMLIKLVGNLSKINELLDTFESVHDLIKDTSPIVHQIGLDAINKMAEFEQKGYLEFVRQLGKVGENIMTNFSAKDVSDLADNIVPILDTVKRVTQPDMLVAVNNAIAVYGSLDVDNIEEYSLWKAYRELRTSEMRRGLGFMINFLKNLAARQQNKN